MREMRAISCELALKAGLLSIGQVVCAENVGFPSKVRFFGTVLPRVRFYTETLVFVALFTTQNIS